ncbi:hypothetical protein ABU162_08440 [Paenibacillus thiaminolyticus]|uniref:hypothetical protein n=1 Tax=Paenibacillus thiaminolyticus TaxID=49283 RepID=UPI0035A5E10E
MLLKNTVLSKKWVSVLVIAVLFASFNLISYAAPVEKEGTLPPGTSITVRPMTAEESALLKQRANGTNDTSLFDVGLFSDGWSGNVNVPINRDGNQGANVGHSFVIAPDNKVSIYVGALPGTMPTINLSIASTVNSNINWWRANLTGNQVIEIDVGSYKNHAFQIKTSTNEANSRSAYFQWYTHN